MNEENLEEKFSSNSGGIRLLEPITIEEVSAQDREEELRLRYLEHLRLLRAIDRVILSAQTIQEIGDASLPLVRELLSCSWAGLISYDFDAGDLVLVCADPGSSHRLGKGWRGPVEWISANPKGEEKSAVIQIDNIHEQALSSPFFNALQENRVSAYLSLPLIIQGRLVGSLSLGREDHSEWTEDELQAAKEVAEQMSIGLQNISRYNGLELREVAQSYLMARRTIDLEAAHAQFKAIFVNATLGIALLDHDGRMIECNPALQQVYGYSQDELKGMQFSGFFLPKENILNVSEYIQELEKGSGSGHMEARHIRKDGSVIWTRMVLSPIQAAGFDNPMAILIIEDITEQKKTQAAMIQAEKLAITGKLAASLAHEINNPLQSSIGCLGLTEEVMAEGGDTTQYLRVATEELARAARIVAQLRDLNQQSPSGIKEPVDLNTLLAQTLMLITKQCKDHQIRVSWSPASDLPPLELVADRVQQVFLNLSLNAIDAMPVGGELNIIARPTGQPEGVRIDFCDTGVGIPPDQLQRIFDPFFSTKTDGLGLGLYITKMIVQDHGGSIQASGQPGEGTTFSIWLPRSNQA